MPPLILFGIDPSYRLVKYLLDVGGRGHAVALAASVSTLGVGVRGRRVLVLVALTAGALGLSACAGGAQTVVTVTATPSDPVVEASPESSEPAADESDPVVVPEESEEPAEPEFREVPFGDPLPVRSDDNSGEIVTLGEPVLAECQYSYSGCEDPEIGDRVVQIPITIKNEGTETVEWGSDYFVLEFADGTQMAPGDGAAIEYEPDNYMSYDVKVRPGSTFKSVLVFEAPKGPFKVLILTSAYDGEPFAAWY